MSKVKCLIILLLATSTYGIAQTGHRINDWQHEFHSGYLSQELGFPLPESANLMLYDTISNWLGTPYKFAGNCTKGIDCSGFVNVLYNHVYGKYLGARNSADIYRKSEKIKKEELKEGDLVFFGNRKKQVSHIGVYLGQDKFVHSSTSRGVIISNLEEAYYRKTWIGAGRIQGDEKAVTSRH